MAEVRLDEEQQTAQRNVHGVRRLGPVLGILGGASGVLAALLPVLGLVLVGQSVASLRSGRNLRTVQLGIGLVVIGVVLLVYFGPLVEELARQMLPSDRFVLGAGVKSAVFGAVLSILGAIGTTSASSTTCSHAGTR
jgi:uncharacterized membrane protein